jgi:ketosteroid isomerase-like protein
MILPESPLAVLERSRRAAIDQSVEDMRALYAIDAVHEFPFTVAGLPSRLVGRERIITWIAGLWQADPLRYQRYRTIAIHRTEDPDTIVVEQEAIGTSTNTGEFVLPNIQVLTAREGQIAHLRDYVNIPAAAAALGQDRMSRT